MPPDYEPPPAARAEDALRGTEPFVMRSDGLGWLYVPRGLKDGPMPTHYEPEESPFGNPLYHQDANPARQRIARPGNRYAPSGTTPGSGVYPFVVTTYRLTEHHTAGGMSPTPHHLSELQPEKICAVRPGLPHPRERAPDSWATAHPPRTTVA